MTEQNQSPDKNSQGATTVTGNTKSPLDRIIELLDQRCSLFTSQYKELFVKVKIGNVNRIMKIRSQEFKDFIILEYYHKHKKAAVSSSVNDAMNYLAAKANFTSKEEMVYCRVGGVDDTIYVDIANKENQAIEITANGWRIIQNPPINFIRSFSMKPLPIPVTGGSLKSLRKFVKVSSNANFLMLVSWIAFSLHPEGPYPVLHICGEAGATKTNLIKMIHAIIDPSMSICLSAPKNKHDVYISAVNSHIVSYDNLTLIPKWFSNELCVISTGNDFSTRQYYTVDEQALLHAKRPQIISGIDNNIITKGDLLRRTVSIYLLGVTKEERKDEKQLWNEFNAIKGALLGAFCDVVVTGLRNYGSVNPLSLECMADFDKFMIACEPALPCNQGDFTRAYENNIKNNQNKQLVINHVASAVVSFMQNKKEWLNTAEATLAALSAYVQDPAVLIDPKQWPSLGNKLRSFLDKSHEILTSEGISVEYDIQGTGTNKGKRFMKFKNIVLATFTQSSVPQTVTTETENTSGEIVQEAQPLLTESNPPEETTTRRGKIIQSIMNDIDLEKVVDVLEQIYQIPYENIEKVNVIDDIIVIETTSGAIKMKKNIFQL